jgi:hypothetical protein
MLRLLHLECGAEVLDYPILMRRRLLLKKLPNLQRFADVLPEEGWSQQEESFLWEAVVEEKIDF